MTAVLLALTLVVGTTIGSCALVWIAGTFATAKVRLEHQREMIKLSEQQKLNALTIRERDFTMTERHLQMIDSASVSPEEMFRQHPGRPIRVRPLGDTRRTFLRSPDPSQHNTIIGPN